MLVLTFLSCFPRYTPIRSDSVVGELILSAPTNIVFPGNPFLFKQAFDFALHLLLNREALLSFKILKFLENKYGFCIVL